jgi:hypothetical protein
MNGSGNVDEEMRVTVRNGYQFKETTHIYMNKVQYDKPVLNVNPIQLSRLNQSFNFQPE